MILAVPILIAVSLFLGWLLVALAINALPLFSGVSAGLLVLARSGSIAEGLIAGALVGIAAATIGPVAFSRARSPMLRLLIVLAFANTHLHAARQWTPHLARRWGLIILICSFGVETLGAATGFPFGTYRYTHNFGPLLGLVPATIPLAWYVVVTNSLFIVRRAMPHTSRWIEAGAAAFLCTLYDFILEPFATTVKRYWLWDHGAIPVQNYAAWFILSGLLVEFFAPTASTRFPRDLRPIAILCLTLLIFLIGKWAH